MFDTNLTAPYSLPTPAPTPTTLPLTQNTLLHPSDLFQTTEPTPPLSLSHEIPSQPNCSQTNTVELVCFARDPVGPPFYAGIVVNLSHSQLWAHDSQLTTHSSRFKPSGVKMSIGFRRPGETKKSRFFFFLV